MTCSYRSTVSPLLTLVSSHNALLLQSLPTNTPFWPKTNADTGGEFIKPAVLRWEVLRQIKMSEAFQAIRHQYQRLNHQPQTAWNTLLINGL